MKVPHLVIIVIFIAVFYLGVDAQDAVDWKNYIDTGNEIWFQAPSTVLIDHDNDAKSVTLRSCFEGGRVTVSKQEITGDLIKFVKNPSRPSGSPGAKVQTFKSDKIFVRQEVWAVGSESYETFYVASNRSLFIVSLGPSLDNAAMKRFKETMRFGGSRLEAYPGVPDKTVSGQPVVFDTLPTSPEVEAALATKPVERKPPGKFGKVRQLLPVDLSTLSDDIFVLRKPKPSYTDDARMRQVQGTILANVQFLASGEIGDVIVDERADRGLGANVMTAARKMKFVPAKVNGKPVDVTRTVIYTFSIY